MIHCWNVSSPQSETLELVRTLLSSNGFGPQVEAVMDRIKDNISLDHMARLLVDVQQDSSGIVDSIISQHQRELLNLIFLGDAPNRNKVFFFSSLFPYV